MLASEGSYQIVQEKGDYYIFNTDNYKNIHISKIEAYVLSVLFKLENDQQILNTLRKKYPNQSWNLKKIQAVKDKYKKTLKKIKSKKKPEKKHSKLYSFFYNHSPKVIIFLFILFIGLLIYLFVRHSFLYDYKNFFWGDNIFFVLLSSISIYSLIGFLHELGIFLTAKMWRINTKMKVTESLSFAEVIVNEEEIYSLTKKRRLIFYLVGNLVDLGLLVLLSALLIKFPQFDNTLISQAQLVLLLKVAFEFIIFKSDIYYLIEDYLNIKGLHGKGLRIFQKHHESKTSKIWIIRAYRLILLLGIVAFGLLLYKFVIPIKYEIYTQAVVGVFFSFFGLDPIYFLECVVTILIEILLDLFTIRFLLKHFFRS